MKRAVRAWLLVVALIALPGAAAAQEEPPVFETSVDEAVEKLTENQKKIQAKQEEITALTEKIEELRGQRNNAAAQADLIEKQLARLTQQRAKAELELEQTQLTIRQVDADSKKTVKTIEEFEQQVIEKRQQLRALFRSLYEKEQESFLEMLLRSRSISEVLAERNAYVEVQQQTFSLVKELQDQVAELERQQIQLEEQRSELNQLSVLFTAQQAEVAENQAEQQKFLAAKRDEQIEYENLLAEAKQARQEIEQHVFTLKGTSVQLSLTAATDMARLAGKLTGVRPALLLGVLKVESNVGSNIGGGKFPDDMQPASREAFLRIMAKLKLDPYTTPISARPRSYQGWGGAMGPAQIMPQTWETIEARISSLMGKALPNPYDLTDAFVANAILLADKGAANPAQEYEAVNRYLAGPNWQRFTWYGDRVLAVAKEYEANGI